jgi:transposase
MKEQLLRDRIGEFWRKHSHKGKYFTAAHFILEGVAKSTIYSILQKLESTQDLKRKQGSGGHNKKLTKAHRASICRWISNKRGTSLRQKAKKYNVNEKTLRNVLKERGVKCYKRIKAPQYTPEQEGRAKTRAGKLLQVLKEKKILMDDEAYFKLKGDYLPGNDHFFTSDIDATPFDVKYRTEKKFPVQLMVWVCVSEDAISEPVFLERPNSVNGQFYRQHCVSDKLVRFICQHHQDDDIIFWPDLASAHYSNETLQLLQSLNIPYVDKSCNPPNIPHCRPVENFWGRLKGKVYEGGWEATTIPQLKRKIAKCLSQMNVDELRADFKTVRQRLRLVNRNGPLSII